MKLTSLVSRINEDEGQKASFAKYKVEFYFSRIFYVVLYSCHFYIMHINKLMKLITFTKGSCKKEYEMHFLII